MPAIAVYAALPSTHWRSRPAAPPLAHESGSVPRPQAKGRAARLAQVQRRQSLYLLSVWQALLRQTDCGAFRVRRS
jgi:hypothetical protein